MHFCFDKTVIFILSCFASRLSITCRRQSQKEIKIAPGELRHTTFDTFDKLTCAGGAAGVNDSDELHFTVYSQTLSKCLTVITNLKKKPSEKRDKQFHLKFRSSGKFFVLFVCLFFSTSQTEQDKSLRLHIGVVIFRLCVRPKRKYSPPDRNTYNLPIKQLCYLIQDRLEELLYFVVVLANIHCSACPQSEHSRGERLKFGSERFFLGGCPDAPLEFDPDGRIAEGAPRTLRIVNDTCPQHSVFAAQFDSPSSVINSK